MHEIKWSLTQRGDMTNHVQTLLNDMWLINYLESMLLR